MTPIPKCGNALIAMRKQCKIPELPVLISFVDELEFTNMTLFADSGKSYDWRCVSALEVELFVSVDTPFADVLRQLAAIAAVMPSRMILTYIEGPRIECGESRTVPHADGDFMLFDWFPIAIAPICWDEARKISQRLFSELGKALPIPYDEAHNLILQMAKEAH